MCGVNCGFYGWYEDFLCLRDMRSDALVIFGIYARNQIVFLQEDLENVRAQERLQRIIHDFCMHASACMFVTVTKLVLVVRPA